MSVYSRLLEQALLPGYDALRGYRHSHYRGMLERSQWWSRGRLIEFQWTELRKLLRHAFDSVPFHRQRFQAAGALPEDIRSWNDFARFPVLTREEITAHKQELCSSRYQGRLIAHSTGGSSGSPLHFYISRDSFEWRCAASERAYSWTGVRLGERTLYLWGGPVGTQLRRAHIKMQLFRSLRREQMFSTFYQDEALWQRIYDRARSWKPKLLVGYASSLQQFSRWLLETGRAGTLPSIEAAIAAAEPVHASLRQQVTEALGIPLFNTYGSREFMSIAGECGLHQGLHVNAENLLVEVEPVPEGEPGAVYITDLHNFGMPFIRYRIGDLAVLDDGPCACGRGLPRIRSIEGRELEVLRTASGRTVPGEFFPHLLKELLEVREFQVRQEAPDRIRISLVLHGELSAGGESLLRREVEKVFGGETLLTIDRVAVIPLLASGKRRVTIGLGK